MRRHCRKLQILPEIEKDGSISDVLKVGQEVLVQIAKEPISTKGSPTDFRAVICRKIHRADTVRR